MSSFDHPALLNSLNQQLGALRKESPDVMAGFAALGKAAMAAGQIDAKHKELIALAIGITQRCSGCIGFHVKKLHALGCTRAELEEMLGVCVYMGGGPALMYAAEALAAYESLAPAA